MSFETVKMYDNAHPGPATFAHIYFITGRKREFYCYETVKIIAFWRHNKQ